MGKINMLNGLRGKVELELRDRIQQATSYVNRILAAKKKEIIVNPRSLGREAFIGDTGDWLAGAYASGLDPATWGAIVREAEGGELSRYMDVLLDIERRDGHLRGVLSSRRNAVAGKKWKLEPGIGNGADKVASAVQDMLDGLSFAKPLRPGESHLTFRDVLHDLSSAVYLGLAAHEIMWDTSSGQAVVDELKWVHPRRFAINTNDDSRPLGELLLKKSSSDPDGDVLWPAKWVIHRPRVQSDWSWRQGLGFPIGWIFCFKAYAIRDWAALSELTGVPMRIAKYPEGSQRELIEQLKSAVASVGVDFYAVVPQGTDLEFVQAQHGGDEEFHKVYATWCDLQISKAVLGHTASADATAGRLGNEDMATQVRQDLIDGDAVMLQSTIERDLIAPYVGINFGWEAPLPRFTIDTSPQIDLEKRSLVDERLAKIGWKFDRSHFENVYDVITPVSEEDTIEPLVKAEIPEQIGARGSSPIDKRADEHFSQGDELIDSALKEAESAWRPFLDEVKQVLVSSREYSQAMGLLDVISPSTEELTKLLENTQITGYVLGRAQIADEAGMLRAPISVATRRQSPVREHEDPIEPWDEDEAVAWLRERVSIPYADFKDAAAAIKIRTFSMKGLEESYILDGVKAEIERAIEEGLPYREFASNYSKLMSKLGVTPTNLFHIETVFENAVSNSIAVSRYDGMRDPDVMAARPYWEYVTAGDSQVRPEHAELEGFVYPADHPFWDTWYPPNGHRCRCSVITLDESEVKARGATVYSTIPPVDPKGNVIEIKTPPTGWDINPAFIPEEI